MSTPIALPAVNIEFMNLTYSVLQKERCKHLKRALLCLPTKFSDKNEYKTLLKSVSGKVRAGELLAIMGPSGAGKSTLMNILAGYNKSAFIRGSIFVNSVVLDELSFQGLSCYIMQYDILLPHLTVKEYMSMTADLRLPERMKQFEKDSIVNNVLNQLNLIDTKNVFTENLSGGQRKRLAIALELVNNPPVMFLDEPTSGLDSISCHQCVRLLRFLARDGRTIICTIHQPSAKIFEQFDRLYMLTDGQCIYRGKTAGVVPYLQNQELYCPPYHNPADYIMEVACGEHGDHVQKLATAANSAMGDSWDDDAVKNIKKNAARIETVRSDISIFMPTTSYPTTFFTQFRVLVKRTFISILRDGTLTKLRFFSHVFVGILIGLLYLDIGNDASKVYSNASFLFLSQLLLMFTALMPTVLTFGLEMGVLIRERLNSWYDLKAYFLAKAVADMPFQIMFPCIYAIIVFYMTNQPATTWRVFLFLSFAIYTSLVAQSFGLLIGAGATIQVAVFLAPISTIPFLLFSGFFVTLKSIPSYLQWISHLSYIRFSFEGMMLAVYGFDREPLECPVDFCQVKNGTDVLKLMEFEDAKWYVDFGVLTMWFFLLRFIAFFVLRWNVRSQV